MPACKGQAELGLKQLNFYSIARAEEQNEPLNKCAQIALFSPSCNKLPSKLAAVVKFVSCSLLQAH